MAHLLAGSLVSYSQSVGPPILGFLTGWFLRNFSAVHVGLTIPILTFALGIIGFLCGYRLKQQHDGLKILGYHRSAGNNRIERHTRQLIEILILSLAISCIAMFKVAVDSLSNSVLIGLTVWFVVRYLLTSREIGIS